MFYYFGVCLYLDSGLREYIFFCEIFYVCLSRLILYFVVYCIKFNKCLKINLMLRISVDHKTPNVMGRYLWDTTGEPETNIQRKLRPNTFFAVKKQLLTIPTFVVQK